MSARKQEVKIKENIAVNEPNLMIKIQLNLTKTSTVSMKEQIETTITP